MIDQDVGWLQVTVQNSIPVSMLDRLGDAPYILRRSPAGERLTRHELREVPSFHILHRKIVLVMDHADFMNGYDVRMPQSCCRRSFRAKPLYSLRIRNGPVGKDLQRHDPVEAYLPGFVNHSHAATADLLQNFVIAELARNKIQGCGG